MEQLPRKLDMRTLHVLTRHAEASIRMYGDTPSGLYLAPWLAELRSAVQNAKYVMEHVTIPTAEVDSGNRQLHHNETKQRDEIGAVNQLANRTSLDSRP